jgi:hypothetical protein
MSQSGSVISTEIYGLNLCLQGADLKILKLGENIIPPIALGQHEAETLRLELAKVQLWEWNQFADVKRKAERRHVRYFRSWLVMALSALAAHGGFPSYWLALLVALISAGMWHWAKLREDRGTRAAQEERATFFPDWTYFRRRFDESPMIAVAGPFPPPGVG